MDIKHIINKLYYENNATKEELPLGLRSPSPFVPSF